MFKLAPLLQIIYSCACPRCFHLLAPNKEYRMSFLGKNSTNGITMLQIF